MKKIFISSDHAGFQLKEDIKLFLNNKLKRYLMNKYIINKILYNGFISSLALIILISCQSESHYTHKPISEFSNDKDSISYSIGADIGDNLISQGVEIDYDAFFTGLKNGYEKKLSAHSNSNFITKW